MHDKKQQHSATYFPCCIRNLSSINKLAIAQNIQGSRRFSPLVSTVDLSRELGYLQACSQSTAACIRRRQGCGIWGGFGRPNLALSCFFIFSVSLMLWQRYRQQQIQFSNIVTLSWLHGQWKYNWTSILFKLQASSWQFMYPWFNLCLRMMQPHAITSFYAPYLALEWLPPLLKCFQCPCTHVQSWPDCSSGSSGSTYTEDNRQRMLMLPYAHILGDAVRAPGMLPMRCWAHSGGAPSSWGSSMWWILPKSLIYQQIHSSAAARGRCIAYLRRQARAAKAERLSGPDKHWWCIGWQWPPGVMLRM